MAVSGKKNKQAVQDTNSEAMPSAEEVLAARDAALQAQNDELLERDLANQLLGRIQLGQGFQKLLTVGSLLDLRKIKESKLYRHLTVQGQDGKLLTVGSWDEFCTQLGSSRQKIDEDLQNLETFGETALESMQQMGLGYRELRKMRKLSEDDQKALIEVVDDEGKETFTKDDFLKMVDDLSAKHYKEKQETESNHTKEVGDLKTRLDETQKKWEGEKTTRENMAARKNEVIDKLERELSAKSHELPQDESDKLYTKKIQEAEMQLVSAVIEVNKLAREIYDIDQCKGYTAPRLAEVINNGAWRLIEIGEDFGLELARDAKNHLNPDLSWVNGDVAIDGNVVEQGESAAKGEA